MATNTALNHEAPSPGKPHEPRYFRKRIVRVALVVFLTLGVVGGWFIYRVLYTLKGLPDAYAMWDTGSLLIDYMKTHENRWPSGWDDLRGSYERLQPGRNGDDFLRGGMTLEQLHDRVGMDWQVDTARLAAMPAAENRFHAIWPRDGNSTLWAGRDPNEMVWDYLHERQPSTAATSQSSTGAN